MTAGVKQEVHLPNLHPFRDESTFLTISSSSGNMHSRPGHQGKRINPDNTANCRGGAVLLGHQVLMRQSPEGVRQEGQEREREGGGNRRRVPISLRIGEESSARSLSFVRLSHNDTIIIERTPPRRQCPLGEKKNKKGPEERILITQPDLHPHFTFYFQALNMAAVSFPHPHPRRMKESRFLAAGC